MRDVVFLGAGASAIGEAALPLFREIRRAVIASSGARVRIKLSSEEIDAALEWLAPEAILLRLSHAGIDVPAMLKTWFDSANAAPNVIHSLAAAMVGRGGVVWTTNYDTLVEEAAGSLGIDVHAATPLSDAEPGSARVIKIHGSFALRPPGGDWASTGGDRLVFAAPGLLAGMPSRYRDRLTRDTAGSRLWVFGYRGADVDVMPAMREAMEHAAMVRWYLPANPEELHRLRLAYPRLAAEHEDVIVSANPAAAFVEDVCSQHPDLAAMAAGRRTDFGPGSLEPIDLRLPPHRSLELVYQLGLGASAHHLPRPTDTRMAAIPAVGRTLTLATRRTAAKLRARATTRLTLRAASEGPKTRVREVARRLAAEDARSSEQWPGSRSLARWLNEEWDPSVALGLIRRLQYEGSFIRAEMVVEKALSRSSALAQDPDLTGSFSFQRAEVLRAQGRFNEARAEAGRGLAALSSTSLALWQEFTRLACDVGDGAPLGEFDMAAARRLRFLFEVVGETHATTWVDLLVAVDLKSKSLDSEAADRLAPLRMLAEAQRSPLLASLCALHLADALRRLGDHRGMRRNLNRVGGWGVQPLLAEVVRAAAQETPVYAWQEIGARFGAKGCQYGERLAGAVAGAPRGPVIPPQPDLYISLV